jgi:fatty acid desaturase 2 (delta-6 desaturase)
LSFAGAWWRNQHNKHHATPQKLQHDVDLNTLPLMAFSRDAPHVASVKPGSLQALWLKYQAFLFFPVTSFLVGLGWTLFLHPKHAARTSRLVELTCMAARYVVFYLSFAPKCVSLSASRAHNPHTLRHIIP